MKKPKRKKCSLDLPAHYLRSKTGTYAEVTRVTKRNNQGERVYRLRFGCGVRSTRRFTLQELFDAGVRWLKRKPRNWRDW